MADKLTDRQKERKILVLQLVASTDDYFHGWLDRGRQIERHIERDRQIDEQRDRKTGRQKERKASRYTD